MYLKLFLLELGRGQQELSPLSLPLVRIKFPHCMEKQNGTNYALGTLACIVCVCWSPVCPTLICSLGMYVTVKGMFELWEHQTNGLEILLRRKAVRRAVLSLMVLNIVRIYYFSSSEPLMRGLIHFLWLLLCCRAFSTDVHTVQIRIYFWKHPKC